MSSDEEYTVDMTLDIYVDYLICATSLTTATGLSQIVDNKISHDQVTRFLSNKEFTASDLWKIGKPYYKVLASNEGALIIDDSIEEKPYTDENPLISWHFSHTKNRSIKGINFLTSLYEAPKGNIPVGYELVKKDLNVLDKKTGKIRRKATISKQQ